MLHDTSQRMFHEAWCPFALRGLFRTAHIEKAKRVSARKAEESQKKKKKRTAGRHTRADTPRVRAGDSTHMASPPGLCSQLHHGPLRLRYTLRLLPRGGRRRKVSFGERSQLSMLVLVLFALLPQWVYGICPSTTDESTCLGHTGCSFCASTCFISQLTSLAIPAGCTNVKGDLIFVSRSNLSQADRLPRLT